MSNQRPRTRGGRGSDYGRRDQGWGSPRSGSSGSPGISGSPRAGRRADRREPVQQPQPFPSSEEHESYVDYLSKKWVAVQHRGNENPGDVTYWKNTDVKSVEQGPTFDVDMFLMERVIAKKQTTSSPPHSQGLYHPHQHNVDTGPADW